MQFINLINIQDTPAFYSGIKVGDIILKVS